MIAYPSTICMLHATHNSIVQDDLDIVPSLVTYDNNNKQDVIPVHISNITTRTVTIAPRSLLCELQPVVVQENNLMFGLTDDKEVKSATKYIHDLKEKLKKSYQLASTSAEKSHMRQNKGYDERVKGAILHKGDKVLVKILAFEGTHKLEDKWEEDPYIV
ncbi:Hypothetical predicted protein [Mytilus galloprovincialis]|uniref:Uncharacterized protein n=1 Tax=Mytilus galloprovincialis TaxID=29158 RepID=A0A8B6EVC2_MYTGA|nr:Hypothetical predicted protein [Mytilus galloprovincialis]